MRALLCHNPSAGAGEHSKEELLAMLQLGGLHVSYCSTRSSDFPDKLKKPGDMVVIGGGDGTVRKVLTRIPDRSVPIGILPLGPANNVALSLGITGDLQELVNGWKSGRTRHFDIGLAIGPWGKRPFVEAIGYGALAAATYDEVGADTDEETRLLIGRAAFRKALEKAKPLETCISIDGEHYDGDVLAVEVLNGRYVGPRLPLCPKGDPSDGKLDVACVRVEERLKMMDWLAEPHKTVPPVSALHARRVQFQWEGKQPLRIDDRFVDAPKNGKSAEVTVELGDRGFAVLLPPGVDKR
jgi:diacylglycerol kinase (ATP)